MHGPGCGSMFLTLEDGEALQKIDESNGAFRFGQSMDRARRTMGSRHRSHPNKSFRSIGHLLSLAIAKDRESEELHMATYNV